MIEPAVGASTWASGSQVWNGNIGTLMAKPKNKPPKIHHCKPGGMRCPIWWNCRTENEAGLPRPAMLRNGIPPLLKK